MRGNAMSETPLTLAATDFELFGVPPRFAQQRSALDAVTAQAPDGAQTALVSMDESGESINVLHVEVYAGLPDPAQTDWQLAPIMGAFGLATEPWVYVMDAEGTIVYRAEGVFTVDEIMAHWQ